MISYQYIIVYIPDHLLDPLPPLVALVLGLLPRLLLLVLPLVGGHQPSQPRVEGRPVGELLQPLAIVVLLPGLRGRRSRRLRRCRVRVLVIIVQVVVQGGLRSLKLRLKKWEYQLLSSDLFSLIILTHDLQYGAQ